MPTISVNEYFGSNSQSAPLSKRGSESSGETTVSVDQFFSEPERKSFNPMNPAAYNARFQSPEHQAFFEQQNPRGAEELKERLYGPTGATVQQAYLASLPRDPQFQAYSAEKAGLDVVGIDKKNRLIIRNPQTGDVSPLDKNFFRDKAMIGQWVKPAAQLATMAVADTLGTMGTGPVGGAALASAAAGATDLAFQKAANDWIGEPINVGHAAGETAGAAAGYATFAAASWGAKGFAKMVQKSIPRLGEGAKEIIQGVTQVKKEPLDFLWEEMKSLKPGEPIEKLIHEKYLSLDIPSKKARNIIFGAENAEPTLHNLMQNVQRNFGMAGQDPKKLDALRAMYKSVLGPEADDALITQLASGKMSRLLNKHSLSEDGLSILADDVIYNLERGESVASRAFGMKKSAILRAKGNEELDISHANNSLLKMLGPSTGKQSGGFGHTDLMPFGVDAQGNKRFIHVFNEDKLSKPAIELYSDFMRKIGFKIGDFQGKKAIFSDRPNKIKLNELWKSLEDFQTKFDKAIDPLHRTLSDNEAAPLSAYLEKLRGVKMSVDDTLAEYHKMWREVKNAKEVFKAMKAEGYKGEKGMIKAFKDISANATGKNETFAAATTRSLRDEIKAIDAYPFMKRKLLPMIDEGVASAKLGNMYRTGDLKESINKLSSTMQHVLPETGNIGQEQAKEALKAIDDSLPKDKKFMWEIQRHLTNIAFNKPGSIYQARWLAFTLASMLGYTHLGPFGILGGIGLASKIQKPETFAKKVIPFLTGAGKAVGKPSSALHAAGTYLGRQAFAQAGRQAGGFISS